ncbi:MAG: hypothetical protein O7J95_05205 [Planctomycetota bacterium]|nr:hypothetical protein [Planctomycetota bacterium]
MKRSVCSSMMIVFLAAPAIAQEERAARSPRSAGAPRSAGELVEALEKAPRERRPSLVQKLIALGPGALEATRRARDGTEDPGLREALARAATWQLVAAITPVLETGLASQLSYDGQYRRLEEHGEAGVRALLALLDDSRSRLDLRIAACRALADVAGASVLPELRFLYNDVLIYDCRSYSTYNQLRSQLGILLAIFGDTHAIDRELQKFEEFARLERVRLSANVRLSNLYYRIRDYKKAVEHYEEILALYDRAIASRADSTLNRHKAELRRLRKEQVIHYYNAACSNSLKGDIERAKTYLRKAVQGDPTHYKNIVKDGDLARLRAHPSYGDFYNELGKLFAGQDL